MTNFQDYIKSVRSQGRYYFTGEEALAELKISPNALYSGIYKLRKKGDIVSPAKNLYIIVPPEHQSMGCIPAEELVPILMKHWNLDYYASLLTAALYHGASHQKPQVFQMMVSKQIKPLMCGRIKIEFLYKKNLNALPTQNKIVKTGYLKISTPELTMMDLFLYPYRAGGLNNIATVLSELIEATNIKELLKLASLISQKAWIQRLGYTLQHIDPIEIEKRDELIHALRDYIAHQSINFIALNPNLPLKGMKRNKIWKIIENTTIESDE